MKNSKTYALAIVITFTAITSSIPSVLPVLEKQHNSLMHVGTIACVIPPLSVYI